MDIKSGLDCQFDSFDYFYKYLKILIIFRYGVVLFLVFKNPQSLPC